MDIDAEAEGDVEEHKESFFIYNGEKTVSKSQHVRKVEVHSEVIKIEDDVFSNSRQLETLLLCDNLKEIGISSFSYCTSLKKIELKPNIITINRSAFEGCSGATELIIPEGALKTIGYLAFAKCNKIKGIDIPNNVHTIEPLAFMGCASLRNVILPYDMKEISNGLFLNCIHLAIVKIPPHVNTIGIEAFQRCKTMKSLVLPGSLKHIMAHAFSSSGLVKVIIPEHVVQIGSSVFQNCIRLEEVILPKVETIEEQLFRDCCALKTIKIPDSVIKIMNWAFCNCKLLRAIEIPKQVTYIGKGAFQDCSQLQAMDLPSNITNMEDSVFAYCNSLAAINFDAKVEKISKFMFRDCSALQVVDFSNANTITKLGNGCFINCGLLRNIALPPNLQIIAPRAFKACVSLEEINIHRFIRSIGEHSFSGCRNLRSVILYDSIQNIGEFAFYTCMSLTCIVIPVSVQFIGAHCFSLCSQLKEVKFHQACNIMTIENNTFENCTSLKEMELPNNVKYIKQDAFKNCISLEYMNASKVTHFSKNAFADCTSLKEVRVDARVSNISAETFSGCINSTLKLTFSESLESVLSLLPNAGAIWSYRGSANTTTIEKMVRMARLLNDEQLPLYLKEMRGDPVWKKYGQRVLFNLNKICKEPYPLAGYFPDDDEEHVPNFSVQMIDDIIRQYKRLHRIVINLTVTIGELTKINNLPLIEGRKRKRNNDDEKCANINPSDTVGALKDIRYIIVGKIISYFFPIEDSSFEISY